MKMEDFVKCGQSAQDAVDRITGKTLAAKDELKRLVAEGRTFLLSLEDAEATTGDDGTELDDVKQFRAALDRAAKAVHQ